MREVIFFNIIVVLFSFVLFQNTNIYCSDSSFIPSTFTEIGKDVLDKAKLNKLDTYLKSPGDNRGFEAIGLLGDKETVKKLEHWMKSTMRSKIRFSMIFSLIMLGKRNHIQSLLMGLNRKLPEYDRWIKDGNIPLNSNTHCAGLLRKLSEYGIIFDAEHIDKLIQGLDHPHSTVVYDVRYVLNKIFGILFVESTDWIHKPLQARKKYIKAWKQFWTDNRQRFIENKSLIINGLEFNATVLKEK
ncbi:hypothetical protein KAJ27_14010 [bacterium]|nr:hypothetical protein [bacterium]